MPEHLRALAVILFLAMTVFAFAKAPACATAMDRADYSRRRNVWIGLTLAAFLAHNFWLFVLAAGTLLLVAARREQRKFALFCFVLFALPRFTYTVPGFGIVNFLFDLDMPRLLSLTVLLPAWLMLRRQPDTRAFGSTTPDKLLIAFLVLEGATMMSSSPLTVTLRKGVFYPFLDVFLPYYVASRSLKTVQDFRDVLMSFVVAAAVLSALLLFEFVRKWLLYLSLDAALGTPARPMYYLGREGNLRASATAGHPIVAGYLVAVAIGFALFLRDALPRRAWLLLLGLLGAGIVAPISRGPWVGAAAMVMVFIATGPAPAVGFARLAAVGLAAIPVLLVSGKLERVIDYLPFIGSVESETFLFRQRLAEASLQVFLDNPILGRPNFIEADELEAMRGSDGMIDLVNTYAIIGLSKGIVGLALFTGFFAAVGYRIFAGMRRLGERSDERYVLGRALLGTLAGVLVVIGTASPIVYIAVVYWCVGGIGAAYATLLERAPLAPDPRGRGPLPRRAPGIPTAVQK